MFMTFSFLFVPVKEMIRPCGGRVSLQYPPGACRGPQSGRREVRGPCPRRRAAVDLQALECLGVLVKYNIRAGGYSDRRTSLRRTAAPAGGARPASTGFGADGGSRRVGRNRSCAMHLACFLFFLVLALASETPKTLPISEIGSTVAVSGPEVVVSRSGPTLDARNRISTAPNSETENLLRFATPIPSCCSRRRAYCESFFKVENLTRSL